MLQVWIRAWTGDYFHRATTLDVSLGTLKAEGEGRTVEARLAEAALDGAPVWQLPVGTRVVAPDRPPASRQPRQPPVTQHFIGGLTSFYGCREKKGLLRDGGGAVADPFGASVPRLL